MTGPDYDDDGPENFQPPPHPDDRLWRHPSEIAAMQAAAHAAAHADTTKLPVVRIDATTDPDATVSWFESGWRRSRTTVGLKVAAGVVAVGATALTIGIMSASDSPSSDQVAIAPAASVAVDAVSATTDASAVAVAQAEGETQLAERVHDEVADSLPRIQAVLPNGMREGSGLFITNDGHIVTSAALIDDADYVVAWTDDGQRWKAHVVASDPVSDVAVIRIDSTSWPPIELETANDPWSGQYALALDHGDDEIRLGQVTTVSEPRLEVSQPAALPGSAIIDDTGTVIAMVVSDGSNSHAAPAWVVDQVSDDLIDNGTTTHNWLGLVVDESDGTVSGVRIDEIVDDSPAAASRLRVGDVITELGDRPIEDAAALHRAVQLAEPGDHVLVTVMRSDQLRTFVVTVGELAP